MASKRRIRMKACSGKRKYRDAADAIRAKCNAIKRTGDNIREYRCGNCGAWHIGHWNAEKISF